MPVLVEQYVDVGDKVDARAAAELWRFGPKAFKSYYNVRDPSRIEQLADSEVSLDDLIEDWPVGTDAKVHIDKVQQLFDSGATIVNVHTGQANQERVIEFYASHVLPHFRRPA